jgi:hypothetical protein
MGVKVEREDDRVRVESCDHEGTTEPLGGSKAISHCCECGKTWPSRFGKGAATTRLVHKDESGPRDVANIRGPWRRGE